LEGILKILKNFLINKLIKFDVITEKELLKIADTGDILLFRGKALGSKITRTFTASHFGNLSQY
jgi:hypothetical protein